jgi:hypothetical protein
VIPAASTAYPTPPPGLGSKRGPSDAEGSRCNHRSGLRPGERRPHRVGGVGAPEDAAIGAVPANDANDGFVGNRAGSPMIAMIVAAPVWPMPTMSQSVVPCSPNTQAMSASSGAILRSMALRHTGTIVRRRGLGNLNMCERVLGSRPVGAEFSLTAPVGRTKIEVD